MNTEFDFNNIGKREPYKVPENFFQSLEDNIIRKNTAAKRRSISPWRIILASAASIAVIISVAVSTGISSTHNGCDIEDVEREFSQLSAADQEYLIEVYQDDIFINQ